jgi:hypothetical protein
VNKSIRALWVSGATAGSLVCIGIAPANALNYANCTALHKDFKHGVAKSYK